MFRQPQPGPTPEPTPVSAPTPSQPRRSTRSNFGQAPELLDPSNHLTIEHTQITDYLLAPANTSPIQHYCAMLGIKLPSGNYGRTISQGGSKRTLHSLEQAGKESKI